MKPICIITARANSKRLKNKNIKIFLENRLSVILLKLHKNLKFFLDIVTTDSQNCKISNKYGVEALFLREKKLADDFATTRE